MKPSPILPSTDAPTSVDPSTIAEPVSHAFKVRDNGETVITLDDYSQTAVMGGSDALKACVIYGDADDREMVGIHKATVKAAAPRAWEAGRHLSTVAGSLASVALRPGGAAQDRARLRATLKAALKAAKVGASGK